MKRLFYISTMQLIIAFLFTAVATAQEFSANVEQTIVKWQGSKVVSGKHEGTVNLKSGRVSMNDGLIKGAQVVIDMGSITDNDLEGEMKAKLEGHLKSEDFFGVVKHPLATLKVMKSEKLESGDLKVSGDMTIKGHTHPVAFVSSVVEKENVLVFSGSLEIDRSLYDVRYGSGKFFDNLGDKAINDIFTLDFKLYLEASM